MHRLGTDSAGHSDARSLMRSRRVAVGIALVTGWACSAAAQTPPAPPRLMVIPFEQVTRDPRTYWLGEGSAVILSDDLLALGAQAITRDDRLRAFERLRVPAIARLSYATVIRLGEIVGASQVIVGSVELQGDELTVRARPIRLDTGRMAPEIVARGPLADVFGVYAGIARRILPDSRISSQEMEQGHPPIAAFEQYIKGLLAEAPATRIAFLNQALMLAPTFERVRLALWNVYTDQSDHQRALAVAKQVPATHRLSRQARFLSGLSLINLAQYQEAFDVLMELNRSAPDPALLNDLGVVQLRRPAGAPGGRAVSYFGDAIAIDSSDGDLFFNLGYAYWLEREVATSIGWLREAVRRNPADHEAHYILGVALQATGSSAEGAREKELAKRLSSSVTAWESRPQGPVPRGLERLKTEVDVSAAFRLENVIDAAMQKEQRELATFHLEAGRRLFQTERDADAIAELRRAVYLAPYQSEAHLLLGRTYLRGGRVQEAIDALKISIWSEDSVPARLALAEAYLAATDPAAARAELQTVLRRDPPNVEARRLLDRIPPQ